MSAEFVLYRADVKGLRPGDDTTRTRDTDGREYIYATTNPEAARAFAVTAFGLPRDHERSVYRVELGDPIVADPDFRADEHAAFVMSHWGTVTDIYEADVSMSVEEANRTMGRYARWLDESPMYDDEGYATVPPNYRNDARFDADDCETMYEARRIMEQLDELKRPRGSGRPFGAVAAVTHQRLVTIALEVFSRRGYDGTTLQLRRRPSGDAR